MRGAERDVDRRVEQLPSGRDRLLPFARDLARGAGQHLR
jgi:hypothetical protein